VAGAQADPEGVTLEVAMQLYQLTDFELVGNAASSIHDFQPLGGRAAFINPADILLIELSITSSAAVGAAARHKGDDRVE
jgi:hypothetical protein